MQRADHHSGEDEDNDYDENDVKDKDEEYEDNGKDDEKEEEKRKCTPSLRKNFNPLCQYNVAIQTAARKRLAGKKIYNLELPKHKKYKYKWKSFMYL